MTNPDFTYLGRLEAIPPMKPSAANDFAYRAAVESSRIRSVEPDPRKWKELIAVVPEDIRPLVREYLLQAYRALKGNPVEKKSSAGDAAIAELAKRL